MGMVSGLLVLMGFAKIGFFMIFGPFFFGPLREKFGKRWKINGKPMENQWETKDNQWNTKEKKGVGPHGAPGVPPRLGFSFYPDGGLVLTRPCFSDGRKFGKKSKRTNGKTMVDLVVQRNG